MLIAKVSLVAIFFFASFALAEKNYSRLSRALRLTRDQSHVKKRQDDTEYFEQCRFVNVWKEQLGYVSVLAFLDPTWQYSFRQAVMLKLLGERLRKSGFPDVRFFVIAPPPDLPNDEVEIELEIEAWRGISMLEPGNLVNDRFQQDNESEMIFVQDGPQSRMWERFRASKDQVVIIDRCGKLTYQVMVPWSILHFPYVKAAILSTYREEPCGACDPTIYKALDYEEYFLTLINLTDKKYKNDDVNVDSVWTTEQNVLANATIYLDKLEKEHETSTVPPVTIDEITNSTVIHFNISNVTKSSVESESAYHDDASQSVINEYNTEETRFRDESRAPEGSTISSISESFETTAFYELQQNIPPKQEESAWTSTNDSDSSIYGDARYDDHTLLDEPAKNNAESKPIVAKTETITHSNDEIQDSDGEKDSVVGGKNIAIETKRPEESVSNVRNRTNPLPLRIIMHAPHVHRIEKKTKKHTYLILKTGNPNYHGHFDSGTEINASSIDSWRQSIDLQTTNFEERNREKTEMENKENANQSYIFDKDESPGLYGEIADYWRSREDSDIIDRNETFNNNYHNSTDTVGLDETDESDSSKAINESDQVNKEEEIRNKLIEHYSKLLPWIYYILNK